MEENRLELEKVKKRRQERELERLEREKMMELEQRQREAAQFSQFSRQEDQFQLEQARLAITLVEKIFWKFLSMNVGLLSDWL